MTATAGSNLGLTRGWALGEQPWGAQMNANLRRLDALTQAVVISDSVATPPGSPEEGDAYLVAASPTGAWTGLAAQVVVWDATDAVWRSYAARAGWQLWVADRGLRVTFDGAGWYSGGQVVFAAAFADLQDALDATPNSGTLILEARRYMPTVGTAFIIDHPMHVRGAGCPYIWENMGPPKTPWVSGTIIEPYNAAGTSNGGKDSTAIRIAGPVTGVTLSGFGIECPYDLPGTPTPGIGDGIMFDATTGYIGFCLVEDVSLLLLGRDGIRCEGASLGGLCLDQSIFRRIKIGGCRARGVNLDFAVDCTFEDIGMTGNGGAGFYGYRSSGLRIIHCLWNQNGKQFTDEGWPQYHMAQLYLQGCPRATVADCDFEAWSGLRVDGDWVPAAVPRAIGLEDCHGGSITNSRCFNEDYVHGSIDSVFIMMLTDVVGYHVAGNQVSACDYFVFGLEGHGIRGNTVLMPTIGGYKDTTLYGPQDAPCRISMPNDRDDDIRGNPSGGNLVVVPMADGRTMDTSKLHEFGAGLQLPIVSSVDNITHDLKDGMFVLDAGAGTFKFRLGGEWVTLAVEPPPGP